MEKDTVALSLDEYNQLRDFKRKVEDGKVFVLSSGFFGSRTSFFTEAEVVKFTIDEANELSKGNNELSKEIYKVRKMSIWQFLKWRKS